VQNKHEKRSRMDCESVNDSKPICEGKPYGGLQMAVDLLSTYVAELGVRSKCKTK